MKSPIARVYVNDVEVGSLPADTYKNIVKTVRSTPYLYLSFFKSLSLLIIRKLFICIQAIPFILIGFLFVMLIIHPESIATLIEEFRVVEPNKLTQELRDLVGTAATLAIFILPLSAMLFPQNWYFYNPFEHEISLRIRRLLEVPTEGKVVVEIIDSKDAVEE